MEIELQPFEPIYQVIPLDGGFIVEFSEDPMKRPEKRAFTSSSDLASFFGRVQAGRASLK